MFCKKVFLEILQNSHENTCVGVSFLNLFRMDFFGAAQAWGGTKKPLPLPTICHTYPAMMKLGTVIPHPRAIEKMYESRDATLEFC